MHKTYWKGGKIQPIRAEIVGNSQAMAAGVTVQGKAPVLSLCRQLIAIGHDPQTPLEAYRGKVLCLRVRSIGEGAKLRVKEDGLGTKFALYDDPRQRLKRQTPMPPFVESAENDDEVA